MNEEQNLQSDIDEMKKVNQKMKQILSPFNEIFDDDFKQTFRQFAQSASCLGLDCLTEEQILLSLSKNIRRQIENEVDVHRLYYDIDEIRKKTSVISQEKRQIDKIFEENMQNKDIILDDVRRKINDKSFFVQKHRQYVLVVDDLENNLTQNRGFVDDIRLEKMAENKKRLEDLQKNYDVLNKRLATYRNLPADECLAKVKIEEKRLELEKLENALNELVENFQTENENDVGWLNF